MTHKGLTTTFLDGEGRDHLDACMDATFLHCHENGLETVVIYTANGIGPCRALENYRPRPEFTNTRIVAVTPPANKHYAEVTGGQRRSVRTGIFGERRKQLIEAKIPIVSARLPFRSPLSQTSDEVPPLDPMQLVDRAFGVLGGGFSLCVQAVLMACDAGYVASGELVAAMAADTAIVAVAAQTESLFSPKQGLLVLHIICKPGVYDISKSEHEYTLLSQVPDVPSEAQVPLPLIAGAPSTLSDSSEHTPVEPAGTGMLDVDSGHDDKG